MKSARGVMPTGASVALDDRHRHSNDRTGTGTQIDIPITVTGGVDTHRDVHMVASFDHHGAELGVRTFDTNDSGHREALTWLKSFELEGDL